MWNGTPLQQVAERHAEYHGRHEGADEDAPVPHVAPAAALQLGTVVETDRAEEQGGQHQDHGDVEAGEGRCVDHRPGGEQRAAGGDQPHLVTVPVRGDGVDHHPALGIGFPDDAHQNADAHVETVGDGEADQQYANQDPPNKSQYFIVKHTWTPV